MAADENTNLKEIVKARAVLMADRRHIIKEIGQGYIAGKSEGLIDRLVAVGRALDELNDAVCDEDVNDEGDED